MIFPETITWNGQVFETPSCEQSEAWVDDSGCESLTGHRVEPDGYGPDGSPSWLIALGLV